MIRNIYKRLFKRKAARNSSWQTDQIFMPCFTMSKPGRKPGRRWHQDPRGGRCRCTAPRARSIESSSPVTSAVASFISALAPYFCSPCSLTWCMSVALSACHLSLLSARFVSITLKISNIAWNNTYSHFYSKIKHKNAIISVDVNIRCARLGCNDYNKWLRGTSANRWSKLSQYSVHFPDIVLFPFLFNMWCSFCSFFTRAVNVPLQKGELFSFCVPSFIAELLNSHEETAERGTRHGA